jgi:hypothetical protein
MPGLWGIVGIDLREGSLKDPPMSTSIVTWLVIKFHLNVRTYCSQKDQAAGGPQGGQNSAS